jgi:hypothetical protein
MTKLEKIKDFCFTPKDMQLKAIKHYPSMSQETYCYEANLYILDVITWVEVVLMILI